MEAINLTLSSLLFMMSHYCLLLHHCPSFHETKRIEYLHDYSNFTAAYGALTSQEK